MDNGTYDFDREQDLLLPVGALLSSANHHAATLGFGFWGNDEGIALVWPKEIGDVLGIMPRASTVVAQDVEFTRVLLEPVEHISPSCYWQRLFGPVQPQLVIEYTGNDDASRLIPTHDSWLVWPWEMSLEDRHATLLQALEAQKAIESSITWPDAVQRSVTDERSALFSALQVYAISQSKKDVLQ